MNREIKPEDVYWNSLTVEQQVQCVVEAKRAEEKYLTQNGVRSIYDTLEYHRRYAPSLN